MGIFSPITDALGLTTDPSEIANKAQYVPYNVQSTFGSVDYDPSSRTFTSSLDPRFAALQSGLFSQYGSSSPEGYLSLMRERAAPYNEAQYQNLENRLFSQGRLDHSQVYQPGGAMRGLFDAQLGQDLDFQLQADQMSQNRQMNLLNQMGFFTGLERGLWNPLAQQGQLGVTSAGNVASLYGSQSQFNSMMTNSIYENIANGIMGGMSGGGFFG